MSISGKPWATTSSSASCVPISISIGMGLLIPAIFSPWQNRSAAGRRAVYNKWSSAWRASSVLTSRADVSASSRSTFLLNEWVDVPLKQGVLSATPEVTLFNTLNQPLVDGPLLFVIECTRVEGNPKRA